MGYSGGTTENPTYVDLGDHDDFTPDGPFSISCWFKLPDYSHNYYLMTKYNSNTDDREWFVAVYPQRMTFGVYDEMDPSLLVPYRANRAIVYCEIRNFFSDRMPDDTFRVTLSSRLEILTADGQSVWTHEEPSIEDVSRQRREDFFLAQLVTFPPELGPGDYVLKVMIEDTSAAKAAEAVHRFRIGSSALSAAGP